MENPIQVRSYEEKDAKNVFNLLSGFYQNMHSEEDWRHLYFNNPEGDAVISLVEQDPENGPVGHYSVIKMHMSVFGEKHLCGKGEGEVFDLSFMKQLLASGKSVSSGFSTDLVNHTLQSAVNEGVRLVSTNPNDLALKSHLAAGYEEVTQKFDIFVLVLKRRYLEHLLSKKIGNRITAKAIAYPAIGILRTIRFFKTILSGAQKIMLESLGRFNDNTDSLKDEFIKAHDCVMIEREQCHLNWRFADEEYKKFTVKRGDEVIGYVVLHIFTNPNGFTESNLVDYILKPGYWKHFREVFHKAAEMSEKYGCDLVRVNYMYDMKETFGISGMLRSSTSMFRTDKRNIVVYIAPEFKCDRSKVLDIKSWYYTDLYFEGY